MPRFSPALLKQLVGSPFGDFTGKDEPIGLAVDGRTAALRIFRKYISELRFWRKGSQGGPNVAFKLTEPDFLIEWPDRPTDLKLPCIIAVPGGGPAKYESLGIGTNFNDESTRDVYGHGTVLQRMTQYIELINLMVMTASRAERRSILQGLETQLSPTEFMAGLKLRMPEYFNRVACFTLSNRALLDTDEAPQGRRNGVMQIELRFETVALVNYTELQPPQFPGLGDQVGPDIEIGGED